MKLTNAMAPVLCFRGDEIEGVPSGSHDYSEV
jgi:hypothetical protein